MFGTVYTHAFKRNIRSNQILQAALIEEESCMELGARPSLLDHKADWLLHASARLADAKEQR